MFRETASGRETEREEERAATLKSTLFVGVKVGPSTNSFTLFVCNTDRLAASPPNKPVVTMSATAGSSSGGKQSGLLSTMASLVLGKSKSGGKSGSGGHNRTGSRGSQHDTVPRSYGLNRTTSDQVTDGRKSAEVARR